jgi:hypothetical protein
VAWWKNEVGNSINWTKQLIGAGVINACIATACDIDNDNDLDVVATAQGIDKVIWWRNDDNISANWTEFTVVDNFIRPWPLAIADMDGDEDKDIIVGSSYEGSKEVMWLENDLISTGLNKPYSKLEAAIYPNPANDRLIVNYGSVINSIEVYNQIGQLAKTLQVSSNIVNVNVAELQRGIYFIKVCSHDQIITKKLMIE